MRYFTCKICKKKHEQPIKVIYCTHYSDGSYDNKDLIEGDQIILEGYQNYFNGDEAWIQEQKLLGEDLQFIVIGFREDKRGTRIAHIVTNAYTENQWNCYIPVNLLPCGEKMN